MPTVKEAVKWSRGTEYPKTRVPPGAIDCHHHIYDSRYPADPGATLLPGDASIADYRSLQKRLGMSRNVIVQPSTYGFDNRLLVASLREFGQAARGVCVVRPDISDADLNDLHEAGVRGVRFNLVTKGGVLTFDMVEPLARRVAQIGWHLQFNISPNDIVERSDLFSGLPCPIVFDHMVHLSGPSQIAHPAFSIVADLMKRNLAWVKLSAPYNDTQIGPPTYADRSAIAQALIQEAPNQLVWGSDWPHPTESEDNKPDDAEILNLLTLWASDEQIRNQILLHNPEKIYEF